MNYKPLERDFYMTGAAETARHLLGMLLVRRDHDGHTSGIIVETEAYAGHSDAACHSYKRPAPGGNHRTNVMFGQGGYAYVYFIYGMHCCFNVVTNTPEYPEAVLIRALEPVEGIELMRERRGVSDIRNLCSGPGKLCKALGITKADYGADLCGNELFISCGKTVRDEAVASTPRNNVDYEGDAAAYLFRFVIRDNRFLSTRKHLPSARRKIKLTNEKMREIN